MNRSICRIPVILGAVLMFSGPVVAQAPDATRQVFSLGVTSGGSAELSYRQYGRPLWSGIRPVYGFSLSSRAEGWAGAGLSYRWQLSPDSLFLRASIAPGVHARGRGTDLGGPISIRSALELGLVAGRGEFTLGIDHRSNAGLYSRNPGLNSLYLSYTIASR